ncbi:MAG TPA: hypothetical protein VNV82_25675 [Bryobacteraceae bacterium]|nr:hypothetical protein [Bryobacteraceae bacterium]
MGPPGAAKSLSGEQILILPGVGISALELSALDLCRHAFEEGVR